VRAVNERSLPTWPPRVKHHRLDPLSFGLSRTWSRPLVANVTRFSWRDFGHASRTASDRQATVTRRSLKRLTGRGREMSDIVDGLETWEWPRWSFRRGRKRIRRCVFPSQPGLALPSWFSFSASTLHKITSKGRHGPPGPAN